MAIYIYLRVSTSAQDTQNQLHGIQHYCQERGIEPDMVVEDAASGSVAWNVRKIGELLSSMVKGDVLLAAEVRPRPFP